MKFRLFLVYAFIFLLCGCNSNKETCKADDCKNEVYKADLCQDHFESANSKSDELISKISERNKDKENSQKTLDFSYKDLDQIIFHFSSGAGAWSTNLSIDAQGKFSGLYSDSDMGDTGDGYPNGTTYISLFSGEFEPLTYVDDYTYRTRIKSLNLVKKEGETWIEDGIKYEFTFPYGLDNAKDIYFYLPGSKVDNLPDGFIDWVRYSIEDFTTKARKTELDFYGMYNENSQMGFDSFNAEDGSDWGYNCNTSSESEKMKELEEKYDVELYYPFDFIANVSDGYINFREGPGMNYSVICEIKNGEEAAISGQTRDKKWFLVEYNGINGWISTSQVKEDDLIEQDGDASLYGVVISASDGYVNLRSEASTNSNILGTISNGESLAVYEESNDGKWLRVYFNGTQGWIAASEVTKN